MSPDPTSRLWLIRSFIAQAADHLESCRILSNNYGQLPESIKYLFAEFNEMSTKATNIKYLLQEELEKLDQ